MKSYYYLCTPYRAHPGGKQKAFEDTTANAALLLEHKIPVFAPITHSHPIDQILQLKEKDEDLYLWLDMYHMRTAEGAIVCQLPGWDKSEGVDWEIRQFKSWEKPIIYMQPMIVPAYFNSYKAKLKRFINNE